MSAVIQEVELKSVFITDDNISIREIVESDIDGFLKIIQHPGFYYYCFDGTRDTVVEFVNQAMSHQSDPMELRKSFMMAVIDKTEKIIGHVTLDVLDKTPNFYDLAYFTHPHYQGRGVATRASRLLIYELFNKLGLSKIVATVHPDNKASQAVLKKLGFRNTCVETEVVSTNGDNIRQLHELNQCDFVYD